MAFAKLGLRAMMWGADKIPDDWFDKVPGGFYKTAMENGKNNKGAGDAKPGSDYHQRSRSHARRDDDRPRHHKSRDRRHSSSTYKHDRSHSGHGRARSSYDGVEDSDHQEHRQRRRQSAAAADRADSFFNEKPSDRQRRRDSHQSHHISTYPASYGPSQNVGTNFRVPTYVGVGAAAGAMAADQPQYPTNYGPPNPTSGPAQQTGAYVPYANIYGQSQSPPHPPLASQQQYPYPHPYPPPPPPSSNASLKPTTRNQVSPPIAEQNGYHQNPMAQEAPYGSQPGYIPDRNVYADQRNPGYGDSRFRAEDLDGYGYRNSSRSPSRRSEISSRYRSPSARSSITYRGDDRRARSERRRSTSRAGDASKKGPFTKSKRGLAYGAAGALYGGLIGTEVGNSPLAPVIGAAVGALGANAFQAREKRKEDEALAKRNSRHSRRDSRAYTFDDDDDQYEDDGADTARRRRYDDYDDDRRRSRRNNGYYSD